MASALTSLCLFQKTIGEFESIFGRMLYLPGGAVDSHKRCLVRSRVGVLRSVSQSLAVGRWEWLGKPQNGRELRKDV